jgi:hypothetical protein
MEEEAAAGSSTVRLSPSSAAVFSGISAAVSCWISPRTRLSCPCGWFHSKMATENKIKCFCLILYFFPVLNRISLGNCIFINKY